MSRKFRSTEISGEVNINSNGQHMKYNLFCINCNGTNNNHYKDCTKPEVYAIPATAEVPRKRASKKTWEIFKKQFVFSKPNGWWFWSENSWWYKNKNKYEQSR